MSTSPSRCHQPRPSPRPSPFSTPNPRKRGPGTADGCSQRRFARGQIAREETAAGGGRQEGEAEARATFDEQLTRPRESMASRS